MCSPLSTARFGEQLPWLLRNLPSLAALPCDVDAIRAFDASADGEDSVVAPSRGHLAEAQAQLLAEGARGGVLHTPLGGAIERAAAGPRSVPNLRIYGV